VSPFFRIPSLSRGTQLIASRVPFSVSKVFPYKSITYRITLPAVRPHAVYARLHCPPGQSEAVYITTAFRPGNSM
jgi:hypothetical protein